MFQKLQTHSVSIPVSGGREPKIQHF